MLRIVCIALLVSATCFGQEEGAPSGRELIDRWVNAKLAELDLKPAGTSDDAEFLRRASLDIAGRIPTLEEAEAFLADRSSDKRERLVDRLLAGDDYARHWAEVWAGTLVGYDSDGMVELGIAAVAKKFEPRFAKNVPLDQFAREIITASGKIERPDRGGMMEGMAEAIEEGEALALFYGRLLRQAGKEELPLALANRFSRVFLGTQISCAQCHDHPFDEWTQEDFYGMAAFFANTYAQPIRKDGKVVGFEVFDRTGAMRRRREAYRGRRVRVPGASEDAKPVFLGTRETPKGTSSLREEFARLLTSKGNPQFARASVNRVWAYFFGRGIVHPLDDFNGKNKPSHPELLEGLAREFQARGYDVKWLIREIALSQAYQRSSRAKQRSPEAEKYLAVAAIRPLTPEQILSSIGTAGFSDPSAIPARDRFGALKQFRFAFSDDEGAEVMEFDGTIPAALLMMNGEAVGVATGALDLRKGGTRRLKGNLKLEKILRERKKPAERVAALYLAALSRYPTERELERHTGYAQRRGDEGYEDLFWTLLNSSEFLFNH